MNVGEVVGDLAEEGVEGESKEKRRERAALPDPGSDEEAREV